VNANLILQQLRQEPFRALALETVGGTWIDIDRQADVLIYDRRPPVRIVLFDSATGRMYVLEPEQVSALEVK
jgi:hypothetical protein